MKLADVNAIITGGNQGLGLEIAREFLKAGASISICARDATKLSAAKEELTSAAPADARILALPCDVADEGAVEAFVSRSAEFLGRVDVLVNNAGVYGPKGPTESVDWDEWRQAIEINLYGTLLPTRCVIPLMKAQKRGKVINLSGGGATQPLPLISAYAASKAAVVRLTETLAEELREYGIDINAVAPGALNTRLLDEVLEAGPDLVGRAFYDRAVKQRESGGAPLVLGASLCVYLASTASDGLTGKLISAQWDPWERFEEFREHLMTGDIYTLRRIVPEDRGHDWTS